LKALYLKGYINGHPVNKMLVDTGATVNIMPYSVLRQLGRSTEVMIKTNVTLSGFNGQVSEAQGVLNVDLTVGSKTVPTSFFIVSTLFSLGGIGFMPTTASLLRCTNV
jgi:predicted aspartyl protease